MWTPQPVSRSRHRKDIKCLKHAVAASKPDTVKLYNKIDLPLQCDDDENGCEFTCKPCLKGCNRVLTEACCGANSLESRHSMRNITRQSITQHSVNITSDISIHLPTQPCPPIPPTTTSTHSLAMIANHVHSPTNPAMFTHTPNHQYPITGSP